MGRLTEEQIKARAKKEAEDRIKARMMLLYGSETPTKESPSQKFTEVNPFRGILSALEKDSQQIDYDEVISQILTQAAWLVTSKLDTQGIVNTILNDFCDRDLSTPEALLCILNFHESDLEMENTNLLQNKLHHTILALYQRKTSQEFGMVANLGDYVIEYIIFLLNKVYSTLLNEKFKSDSDDFPFFDPKNLTKLSGDLKENASGEAITNFKQLIESRNFLRQGHCWAISKRINDEAEETTFANARMTHNSCRSVEHTGFSPPASKANTPRVTGPIPIVRVTADPTPSNWEIAGLAIAAVATIAVAAATIYFTGGAAGLFWFKAMPVIAPKLCGAIAAACGAVTILLGTLFKDGAAELNSKNLSSKSHKEELNTSGLHASSPIPFPDFGDEADVDYANDAPFRIYEEDAIHSTPDADDPFSIYRTNREAPTPMTPSRTVNGESIDAPLVIQTRRLQIHTPEAEGSNPSMLSMKSIPAGLDPSFYSRSDHTIESPEKKQETSNPLFKRPAVTNRGGGCALFAGVQPTQEGTTPEMLSGEQPFTSSYA